MSPAELFEVDGSLLDERVPALHRLLGLVVEVEGVWASLSKPKMRAEGLKVYRLAQHSAGRLLVFVARPFRPFSALGLTGI